MSYKEYSRTEHSVPYVVDIVGSKGRLVYFGASHRFDPSDQQFDELERRFVELKPLLVLNEGGNPSVEADREAAVRRAGEAGLVRFLAARHGTRAANMDLTAEDETPLSDEPLSQDGDSALPCASPDSDIQGYPAAT